MVEKVAIRQRARRIEPAQEEIVSSKDALNDRISKLITFLIELKRGMNGGPAPGIGVPKYKLTQPMPDQVVSSGQLAREELDAIIDNLRQIDTKQDQYAENKVEQLNQRVQQLQQLQQQTEEQAQQQATATIEYELKKLASSKLSRLWAHIAGPFTFSEKGVKERLSLLRTLARMNSNLKDLEDKVLSGSSSALDAVEEAKSLYLDARMNFFQEYRSNLNNMLLTTDGEVQKAENEAKLLLNNVQTIMSGNVNELQNESFIDLEYLKDKKESLIKLDDSGSGDGQGVVNSISGIVNTLSDMQNRIDSLQSNQPVPNITPDEVIDKTVEKPIAEEPSEVIKEEPSVAEEPALQGDEFKAAEYIANNAKRLYEGVRSQLGDSYEEEEPWGPRVYEQWNAVNEKFQALGGVSDRDMLFRNYDIYTKAVGDLLQTLSKLNEERIARESRPDIDLGSSLNEVEMHNEALKYMQARNAELQRAYAGDVLQANASRFGRWFKRMMTNLSGSKDKHIRLRVAKDIRDAREGLSRMMDNLEKRHLNFRSLFNDSNAFYSSIINVFGNMVDLAEHYNSQMRIDKAKRKYDKERFRYDLIPSSDISFLKKIRTSFYDDNKKILELAKAEERLEQATTHIDDIKKKIGVEDAL